MRRRGCFPPFTNNAGMQESLNQRRRIVLLAAGLAAYWLTAIGVVLAYKQMDLVGRRLLQNGVYLFLLALALVLMRAAKKPWVWYGASFCRLPLQVLIGVAVGGGLLLFMWMLGHVPAIPQEPLYVALSQLLVGLSEETFWRGFVLHMLWDTTGSKDTAVLISSLLFGCGHVLLGGSLMQVVVTAITGMVLAVLRTEFPETVGIPALAIGHALANIV